MTTSVVSYILKMQKRYNLLDPDKRELDMQIIYVYQKHDNKMLVKENEFSERWKSYFNKLLNDNKNR